MTTEEIKFRKLYPDEGKYLTQASLDDESNRVFSTCVSQPSTASEDEWIEVDEAYKQEWEEQQAAVVETQRTAATTSESTDTENTDEPNE